MKNKCSKGKNHFFAITCFTANRQSDKQSPECRYLSISFLPSVLTETASLMWTCWWQSIRAGTTSEESHLQRHKHCSHSFCCHATKRHLCPTADRVLAVLWTSTPGFKSNDCLEVLKTFQHVRQHSKVLSQLINYSIKYNLFTSFVVLLFLKELSNTLFKSSI